MTPARFAALGLAVPGLLAVLPVPSTAQALAAPGRTMRASVSSGGGQAQEGGIWAALSADGRHVAFVSHGADLVPLDTNLERDVFVHDRLTGTTERVSVDDLGVEQDAGGFAFGRPAISADGRYVAFDSPAFNLTDLDTHGVSQIYVRDRLAGTTRCVSLSTGGECADADAGNPLLSADGRYVAFSSSAGNLVAGDDDGVFALDVFVHDRRSGQTEEVSWGAGGRPVLVNAILDGLSDDGRFVSFHSFGSGFVADDFNGVADVFLHDRQTGATELVSRNSWGRPGNATSAGSAVSADGRYVVFSSEADNLVPGDGNGTSDVFRRDRRTGATVRVSVAADGGEADGHSAVFALSSDGRFAFLESHATDLVPGDGNGERDLFRKDLRTGAIERVNVSSAGAEVGPGAGSVGSHCTPDGQAVGFLSQDGGLVPGDTNGTFDSFVRELDGR
ncbi:MAG TPA: hypothetical protein VFD43_07685 [Planctomycetota bacterium]|nr:hypothetical protein [Planctomycetota bacterium]